MGREKGPRALPQAWLILLLACAPRPAPTPVGFLAHENFEARGTDRKRIEAHFRKLEGSIEFVVRAEVMKTHRPDENPFAAVSVEMVRNDRGAQVACTIRQPKHSLGSVSASGTSRGEEHVVPVACTYEWKGACGGHASDSGVPAELREDATIALP
jgi:hypothetical protein